jgi:outer membrane protein assembly factor BamB
MSDYLYAIHVKTGQEKWKFKTEGEVLFSSPAIAENAVYVGSLDGYLYAIDGKTGQEEWKFKTGGGVVSSPAVAGGVVVWSKNSNPA